MVYVRLLFLALIASLCEVSQGQCVRRRASAVGSVPRVVPRVPAPACSSASRYERTLEDIISKLINALIYTAIQNGGSGGGGVGGGIGGGAGGSGGGDAGGGSGSGGSGSGGAAGSSGSSGLLDLDAELAGQDLLRVLLLPDLIQEDGGVVDNVSLLKLLLGGTRGSE